MEAKQVFRAPRLKRRLGAPLHVAAAIVVTAGLPIAALSGLLGSTDSAVPALRVAIIFLILMAAFRLLGKRELGRLSPFELVTLMLIPEVLSNALQGEGSLLKGVVGLSTLLLLVVTSSALAHRFRSFERVVEAEPTILIAHGRVIAKSLNTERILPDELLSEMRKQGIAKLDDVAWAVLENSGNITFIPESHKARNGSGSSGSSQDDSPIH